MGSSQRGDGEEYRGLTPDFADCDMSGVLVFIVGVTYCWRKEVGGADTSDNAVLGEPSNSSTYR